MYVGENAVPGTTNRGAAQETIRNKPKHFTAEADPWKFPMGIVGSCRSPVRRVWEPTWDEFAERLKEVQVGEKDGEGYVPGHTNTGARNGSNITAVPVLVIDVEAKTAEPPSVDHIMFVLEIMLGWQAVAHTTYSHTAEHPRYRIALPLSRDATPAEIKRIGPLVAEKLGLSECHDPASFSTAQLFYFPRVPEDRRHLFQSESLAGAPVDVDALLAEDAAKRERVNDGRSARDYEEQARVDETPYDLETLEHLASALRLIDADDYPTWIEVGLALKSLDDAGRELWLHWSATSPKFIEETDPARWDTFKPTRGIDYRKVFKLAQDQGWINPKSRRQGPEKNGSAEDVRLDYIDFSDLEVNPPLPRAWVVPGMLPRGHVTGLFGPGGVGKSLLALQLGIAAANSRSWLGLSVEPGPVVGLFAEDDRDEMRRRTNDIFQLEMLDPAEASARLHLEGRAGKPNVLISFDQDRVGRFGALFHALAGDCERIRPVLVILDNIAQTFAGLQNDAGMVTQFCNGLTKIAQDFNCAVLLLGHPAKSEGSEYSGTVAWENAVRSRLFLGRNDDRTLTLKTGKANYAALTEFRLEYYSGTFRPLVEGDTGAAVEAAKTAILSALEILTKRQMAVSQSARAGNYLVKVMRDDPGLCQGHSEKVLRLALNQLIDGGKLEPNVELPWRTGSRHKATGLAIVKRSETAQ